MPNPEQRDTNTFRPMIDVIDVLGELEDIEDRNLRMIESFQTSQDNLEDTIRHHLIMAKRKDQELKHMKDQKYLIKAQIDRLTERGKGEKFMYPVGFEPLPSVRPTKTKVMS